MDSTDEGPPRHAAAEKRERAVRSKAPALFPASQRRDASPDVAGALSAIGSETPLVFGDGGGSRGP